MRKRRGDVHRDGDWHAAMHLWVGGVDEQGAFVLFQRRSETKDTWPGFLDVAVGGHLRAGESFAETVREAEEEIGLDVGYDELVRIGRRFMGKPGDGDREVQEIFAVRCDLPLEAYVAAPRGGRRRSPGSAWTTRSRSSAARSTRFASRSSPAARGCGAASTCASPTSRAATASATRCSRSSAS